VLLMKDRAGRVGARGVHDLLGRLVGASPDVRVHLIGHSYGCRVVLSALCAGDPPVRPVDSVLLLEPATSALCFATDVDGSGRPGGYRPALERSRQPILTTFSGHDVPLTKLFHFAARRASDLGDAVIAGTPLPSRYAALGGFGPYGCDADSVVVPPATPPQAYPLGGPKRVIAVQGDSVISGHGDVANPATAWMLLDQVMS
jgi:pimeloyl-ACP methyl ester carboxylesterase